MADLDGLTSLLRRLHELGRTRQDLPLYLTEAGYQTNPPDPTQTTSVAEHARRLPEGEQIARRQPLLRSVAQFLVRDLPERPGASARLRWGDYQSGLRHADGQPKPAHASFHPRPRRPPRRRDAGAVLGPRPAGHGAPRRADHGARAGRRLARDRPPPDTRRRHVRAERDGRSGADVSAAQRRARRGTGTGRALKPALPGRVRYGPGQPASRDRRSPRWP